MILYRVLRWLLGSLSFDGVDWSRVRVVPPESRWMTGGAYSLACGPVGRRRGFETEKPRGAHAMPAWTMVGYAGKQ